LLQLQQRNAEFVRGWAGDAVEVVREQAEHNARTAEAFARAMGRQQEASGRRQHHAVEAALEISLTVDEAEDILTSLADRGHWWSRAGCRPPLHAAKETPRPDPRIA
jgi:hypothetical protein